MQSKVDLENAYENLREHLDKYPIGFPVSETEEELYAKILAKKNEIKSS